MINLPQNLEAERMVIGACLLSKDALGKITEILKPEDFYDVNNRIAYQICTEMYFANCPVELVSFQDEAIKRKVYDRLGGQPFLAELIENITTTANAPYYAGIIKNLALRRHLIDAGNKISALAEKNDNGSDLIGEVEKIIFEASSEKESSAPVEVKDLTDSVMSEIKALKDGTKKNTGFMSNFEDLDKILTGFQPGTLNIIAARPSMGKTALALNIAQFGGNKEANNPVLFFSLEMSQKQLTQRMLSSATCNLGKAVELSAITSGNLSDYDYYTLENAQRKINERKIFIHDTSELTAMDFRTKCRRFKTQHPDLSLIVVDYLQLMSSGTKRSDTRQYEVAEISRIMKSVAVELDCPVIALSQLSRDTEKRNTKKPQLSDLRDSGAIEQDADTVLLLYRDDYYSDDENNTKINSVADIRVAKNRNGSTGTCKLIFMREYTKFDNHIKE